MRQWIVYVLFLTLAAVVVACAQPENKAATAQSQQSTVIAQATGMARALRGTEVARLAHATATADAWQNELRRVKRWPVSIQERFDDNSLEWMLGEEDGEYAIIQWQLQDGIYRWEATAKDGFIWWMRAEWDLLTDFYAAVDVRQISGPESGQMGLAFRQSADDRYHTFTLRDDGTFSLDWFGPDGWTNLIEWTPSDAIRPDGGNRIAVLALGQSITLFINEQWVARYDTSYSQSGTVAIFVCLDNAGDQAVFEFDNFELRLPRLPAATPP